MSKKKSFSGSTPMKLKDFHGGSIPSKLTLPSAPGVPLRPSDRSSPRAAVPITDHHRPRVIVERGTAFISTPSLTGCHFDEDERKPFNASSAPRRLSITSTDATRPLPMASDPAAARSDAMRPVTSPVVAHHLSPSPGVSTSSSGNAWVARKEVIDGGSCGLSGPADPYRFAQASAIEKVSSGRWQLKPAEVETIRCRKVESTNQRIGDGFGIREDEEKERSRDPWFLAVDESNFGGFQSDGLGAQESVRSRLQAKDRNGSGFHSDLGRPVSPEGRLTSSQNQQSLNDTLERPKLKLLPRTKPLEPSGMQILDDKRGSINPGYEPPASTMHMGQVHEMHASVVLMKPGSAGADVVSHGAERSRLNLKPRSQPIKQIDETFERGRQSVFGGARPRELVLKERGIDVTDNSQILPEANWADADVLKTEPKLESGASTTLNRHFESGDSSPSESRNRMDIERIDNQPCNERMDAQRDPRRHDNWRKPVDKEMPVGMMPKPETPPGHSFGKAASPLQLAQAFSRSVYDSKPHDNHHTNQTKLPSRTQVPFSRLTNTREIYSGSTQRQING